MSASRLTLLYGHSESGAGLESEPEANVELPLRRRGEEVVLVEKPVRDIAAFYAFTAGSFALIMESCRQRSLSKTQIPIMSVLWFKAL
jgi:hypothetical protein